MKIVKSKSILVASILSMFLVQIAYSVTNIIQKPAAKLTARTNPYPSVTINILAQLQDISLGGNNMFTPATYPKLLAAINNGETVYGTIEPNGSLTLTSATSNVSSTCTFWTLPNKIAYFCAGDTNYTTDDTMKVDAGTKVTIIGTKIIPSVVITLSSNVSDIYLSDASTSRIDFLNKTALIDHLNKGEKFVGTVNSNKVLILKSPTSTTTATGTFNTKPKQISYSFIDDNTTYNQPITAGTFVTIVSAAPIKEATIQFRFNQLKSIILTATNGDSHLSYEQILIDSLNRAETFTGTITNGTLTLTNSDNSITATGTFKGTPKNISYTLSDNTSSFASVTNNTKITIESSFDVVYTLPQKVLKMGAIDGGGYFYSDQVINALNNGDIFVGEVVGDITHTIFSPACLPIKNLKGTISGLTLFMPESHYRDANENDQVHGGIKGLCYCTKKETGYAYCGYSTCDGTIPLNFGSTIKLIGTKSS